MDGSRPPAALTAAPRGRASGQRQATLLGICCQWCTATRERSRQYPKRHEHLELLDSGDVSERVFGRWAMAKVAAEGGPDIPLLTNVDKGGISPAQPRPITEAQEAVLDVMRQSLRHSGASAAD